MSDKNEMERRLINSLKKTVGIKKKMSKSTYLVRDLHFHSILFLSLAFEIKKKFNVDVKFAELLKSGDVSIGELTKHLISEIT